jgi:hypothetical protein
MTDPGQEPARSLEAPPAEQRRPTATPQQTVGPRKDIWDKLSAISTFLSGVVLAAFLGVFTLVYNERERQRNAEQKGHENRLAEIQTVEKFKSCLDEGTQPQLRFCLLMITSLNKELVAKILTKFRKDGTFTQQAVASDILRYRDITFFDNWNLDEVTEDRFRFPAYLKGIDDEAPAAPNAVPIARRAAGSRQNLLFLSLTSSPRSKIITSTKLAEATGPA